MQYVLHVINLTAIYALVVLGLQLGVGRGQVLFVAPTVFFAIGAYTSAVLTTAAGWYPPAAALVGTAAAGIIGFSAGGLSVRLAGDHLLLASLGLCEITRSILNNWYSVTNGAIGIMNIPPLFPSMAALGRMPQTCVFSVAAVVACLLFSRRLAGSLFGQVHASFHGDEHGTAALGCRVNRTKQLAIAWGAAWTALAGTLFVHSASYVDPTTFTVTEAMTIFAMLIVGGIGKPFGAVAGAAIFIVLPELLRFIGIPGRLEDPLRRVLYGGLLLGTVLLFPAGVAGARKKGAY